jgi:predicted transcriptional regulator
MSPRSVEVGPLELDVLGILEAGDEKTALPVAEIRDRLSRAGQDLAYTTIMTVLVRLHRKGIVDRRKEGRQFFYSRARSAARMGHSVLARIQRSLFRDERLSPILTLLESDDELSADELRELRKIVDAKLRKTQGRG